MSWETVEVEYPDNWDFEDEPVMVGIYKETRVLHVRDAFGAAGATKESNVHDFFVKRAEGDPWTLVSIWGAANLDLKLDKIPSGAYVRVAYTGKEPFTRKDQRVVQMKTYDVAVSNETPADSPLAVWNGGGNQTSIPTDDDIPF